MAVTVPGTVSRDDIIGVNTSERLGSSVCLSFLNDKVFISSNSYNNNTGLIRIYESSGTYGFNWNLLTTINGNSNDNFGYSIDTTWDGDILCVGAPGNDKIYIYEDTSISKNWSSYVSNSISGNLNSEFGFSVSINKDTGNNIAVGAPGENGVSIIQKVSNTWSAAWSNTWTTSLFRNYIYENSGATGTQTLLYIDETSYKGSPRYGHSVSLSGYGNYLAVGAPGEIIPGTIGLDVSNVYYTNNTQPSTFYRSGEQAVTHTRPFDTAALGHVVCYKTDNVLSDWRTHSSVTQYGPVIRGDTADDTDTMPRTSEPSHSWGFPACGKKVQMSIDGSKVMAGSPHYAKAGKDAFSSGKIEGWEYNKYSNTWVIGKSPLVGESKSHLGQEFVLDYAGTRATSCSRKNDIGNGKVLVTDFNGTGWYEVTEGISFNTSTETSGIHISNGALVAVADPTQDSNKGRIRFYDFPLTQIIQGNTLSSGYIAADSLRIGSNDNAVNDNVPKRISFGGTYEDNEYHMTEIENRSFYYDELNTDVDLQGNSELIFMKKSTGDMCDIIRIKANEFRIDNYLNGDGDYDHTPRLTMDNVGNFKLNGEMVFNSERGQANVKALLDIEGDCFTRRRLNAGFSTGNDTLGIDKFPFNILYDTRTSIVKDNNNSIGLVSNVNVWNRGVGGTATRWYTNGPISGTINYHTTEGAISLYTSSTYSENTNHDQAVQLEGFKISFWIKLQNEHSTYSTKTLVGVGTLATSGVTGCRVQITSDRIQMNFGDYQIYPSTAYTFTANNWYHIWVQSDPVDNAGLTNSLIKINDVSLTLSSSGTISNKGSNYDKKFYVGSNISGDSAINIYIGNIAFYPKISAEYYGSPENPTSTDMYNWGPPEQKLVVGGQAYIQSSLGINKFIPSYELDVAGDINLTGTLYQNGSVFSGGGGSSVWTTSGSDIYYNAGDVGIGTSSPYRNLDVSTTGTYAGILLRNGDSNQAFNATWPQIHFGWNGTSQYSHFIRTRHNSGASDNGIDFYVCNGIANNSLTYGVAHGLTVDIDGVGIGTMNTSYKLDVVGDINFTGTLYQNGSVFSGGGGSSVWTTSSSNIYYNSGNVGIGTINPAYLLDVAGNINFTGTLYQNGSVFSDSPWTTSGSGIYYISGNVGIGGSASSLYKLNVQAYNQAGIKIADNYQAKPYILFESSTDCSTGLESGIFSIKNSSNFSTNDRFNLDLSTGNLGLGTSTPSYKLDVVGDINFTGELSVNGSAGTSGQVLTSRGAGSAPTWTTISSGAWTTSGSDIYYSSGNVGIGVTPSSSTKLNITSSNQAGLTIYDSSSTKPYMKLYTGGYDCAMGLDGFTGHFIIKNSSNFSSNDRFNLDLSTGNLGLGTSTPSYKLDVVGDINFTGELSVNGSAGTSGQVLTSSGAGSAPTWTTISSGAWTTSSSNIYYNSGNVGIGTINPAYLLDVAGNINFTGTLYQNGSVFSDSPWTTSGSGIYYISGNVGIGGSASSLYKLNVQAYNQAGIKIADNYQAKPYILFESSTDCSTGLESGIFSIKNSSNFSTNDRFNLDLSTGNLGLGTSTPSYKLDVVGDINFTGELSVNGSAGTSGQVLTSRGAGSAPTWTTISSGAWTTSGSDIYYSSGNVGIGVTPSSSTKLNITSSNQAGLTIYDSSSTKPYMKLYTGGYDCAMGLDGFTGHFIIKNSSNFSSNDRFNLDLSTGNLGLGTSTPSYKLDVVGDINFTGELSVNGSAGTSGQVLTSSGAGSAPTWTTISSGAWTTSSSNIYYNSGNVGIGTINPAYLLDVAGNINFTGTLYQNGSVFSDSPWTTSGSGIYYISGNVGIGGSASSLYKLNVQAYNQAGIKIADNYQAKPYILFESSTDCSTGLESGIFSIKNSSNFSTNDRFNLDLSTGNLGLGTSTPSYKLDVVGDINFTGELSVNGSAGTSGQVLTSRGAGSAPTWTTISSGAWTTSGSDIYYSSGNVGIGVTPSSSTKLNITSSNQAGLTI